MDFPFRILLKLLQLRDVILKKDFDQKLDRLNGQLDGAIPYNRTYRLSIKQRFESQSLLNVYRQMFPNVPENVWEHQINLGLILLDDQIVPPSHTVRAGQVSTRVEKAVTEPDVSLDIKFIFSNQDFLVIDKPSPLPVHSAGQFHKNTLIHLLKKLFRGQEFYPIHRLDANTTGVVVLGLRPSAVHTVQAMLQNGGVQKEYLAVVKGLPPVRCFESTESISQDKSKGGSRTTLSGRKSKTQFEVLRSDKKNKLSLLKIRPITGRTNQIRVHLAQLGFPILGDVGYENPSYFDTHPLTYPHDSLFLHATRFGFMDEGAKEELVFEAAIPHKFLEVIDCSAV